MTGDPVYLETVGLLALWDDADQWHAPAGAAFREITARRRAIPGV